MLSEACHQALLPDKSLSGESAEDLFTQEVLNIHQIFLKLVRQRCFFWLALQLIKRGTREKFLPSLIKNSYFHAFTTGRPTEAASPEQAAPAPHQGRVQ